MSSVLSHFLLMIPPPLISTLFPYPPLFRSVRLPKIFSPLTASFRRCSRLRQTDMRIAQISTLSAPVRRETGGSVESLIGLLTRELVRLGHEVTVFGTAGSEVEGELVATLPGPYGAKGSLDDWHLCEWVNLCRAVGQSDRFDVLHSHAYLWGILLEPFSRAPMVH